MIHFKKHNLAVLCVIIILCIIAWIIQSNLLLHWDVSWDLLATQRLMDGGSYTHDLFDLNPPLIFYIYAPSILLAKLFSMTTVFALRLYLFALSLFSLWICYALIRRILLKESLFLADAMLVSIVIIFLLLPSMDFGEREHLLIIFTFPYFLTVAYRLQNNPLNKWYAIGIGIFSVLGFALKPYFLMAFILVELLTMVYTRQLLSWVRAEVITIITCLTAYLGFILIFYPDYLSTVVPLAQHFYYAGFRDSWKDLLGNGLMLFCAMGGLLWFFQYKNNAYKKFYMVFLLAMIGFLAAYFIQQTAWNYHAFPSIAIALFLISLLFGSLMIKQSHNVPLIGLLAVFFFTIPISYIGNRYTEGLQFKQDQQVLMTFLQTHAQHQPVYFITASPREIFPTIAYTNSIYASRLLHLFWIPAVVKKDHSLHAQGLLSSQLNKDEMTFIDMIADDIETHKAKFILVDIKQHKSFFLAHSFDYLPYLLKNNRFQTVFKHYQYFTTIESKKHSLRTSHGSLYWAKNRRAIHPKKIDGNAVVLTGTGKGTDMIAYYIENQQLIRDGQTVFHTHLHLTPHELSQLSQREGKVPITMENKQVIQDIIDKSTQFPAYQFQIYVRQNTSTQGIS